MPRYLSLSNGRLLVNFDRQYDLRDLYWPHVGQENHTEGGRFRLGVFCEGRFSWVADSSWDKQMYYGDDTIISHVTLRHQDLHLALVCRDVVDVHEDVYLRHIEAIDERPPSSGNAGPRSVRLFFAQDFHIYGTGIGDTAYYEPQARTVFHYKKKRWFLIDTAKKQGGQWVHGVDQWSVGESGTKGKEGTWRDAEDGELSGAATAQGSVDSVVALHLEVPPGGRAVGCYAIAVARDRSGVAQVHRALCEKPPEGLVDRTRAYWKLWVGRERPEETNLSAKLATLYRRSLLVIRGHMDDAGGIVAATDYDTARASHDTYSYVWPRDGALAAAALIRAGYEEAPERFFTFCHSALAPEGYLLHKFNPDGSLASTWEGWYPQGQKVLPIQEDETALVVWALRLLFERFHNVEFIKPLY
jgi:glucoamylase